MIKKLLFVVLLIVGLAAVGLNLALRPLQYGMPEGVFSPGPRDATVVADVVKPAFAGADSTLERRPNVVVIFADVLAAADDTAIRKLMVSAATGFSKLGMTDMAGGIVAGHRPV